METEKTYTHKKAVYLVDYENVNTTLLANDEILHEGDTIVIFYSEHASSISIDVLGKLQSRGIGISFVKTTVGTSNALDFQLVSYLGYLVHENRERLFYIVSHDNGFRCVCDFWKEQQVAVNLIEQIGNVEKEEKVEEQKVQEQKREESRTASTNTSNNEYEAVLRPIIANAVELQELVDAIEHAKTRMALNVWITKRYTGEQLKQINKAIKPLVKHIPGK